MNNASKFSHDSEVILAQPASSIRVNICDKTVVTELSDDFTLPDYRPEIRRLLKISVARPTPSVYTGGGSAEFSGDAVYKVLYVGDNGKLCSAELTAVYEADAPLNTDKADTNICAYDEIEAENIVGRVTAPRKLNIRLRLRHRIKAEADCKLADFDDTADKSSIIKLAEALPSRLSIIADDDSYEIEESIQLPPDTEVLYSDAVPFITSAEAKDGGILCAGALHLLLSISDASDNLEKLERKIPFEAVINADINDDGWDCRAWGCATEAKTEVTDGGIKFRIRLSLCAEAQKNIPVKLTRDIYATDRPCEIKCESHEICRCAFCSVGNFTLSGAAELSGLPENYQVIASFASAEHDELSTENGKYILTGKCRFSALISDGGEFSCREFELPFKYEFGNANDDPADYSAKLTCPTVRVRGDSNTLYADAEICAAIKICESSEETAVAEASFGAPDESSRSEYTVVYVPKGESLWNISKKYSVDPASVAAANGIRAASPAAPDSLSGVDFLII